MKWLEPTLELAKAIIDKTKAPKEFLDPIEVVRHPIDQFVGVAVKIG